MNTLGKKGDPTAPPIQSFGGLARTGTVWTVMGFGLGQILRLVANVALAAILFEEAFALMAIVSAVLMGLGMFSDIGLQTNVVQNTRGDDPDFLNTAWTLQVMRGVFLFLAALALAWPVSQFYGANDPKAYELLYLIPIVALTCLIDGFKSAKAMSAARHLRIKALIKIELIVGPFHVIAMLALAWYLRSVYALAIAAVLSNALSVALSYLMLDGPRSCFRWEKDSVFAIISFGKWIFLSTLISFFAIQMDRLTFAAMYPLAEVGVYSIAAGLALMVAALVGRLQGSIVFPWYARMLQDGVELPEAFHKAKTPILLMSTYLVVLLIVGASSFFSLLYDNRYSQAAVFLPILAAGAWLSTIGGMYGAAFLAKGQPKWIALVSAVKVLSFLLFLGLLSFIESTLVMATMALLLSEAITLGVGRFLGWRLGLRNLRIEAMMLALLLSSSVVGLWLVHGFEPVAKLHPALQMLLLGAFMSMLFAPLFVKLIWPILKQRAA